MPAGERCSYICDEVLPQFGAALLRVAFYRLQAGAKIGEHRDCGENRTMGYVRIQDGLRGCLALVACHQFKPGNRRNMPSWETPLVDGAATALSGEPAASSMESAMPPQSSTTGSSDDCRREARYFPVLTSAAGRQLEAEMILGAPVRRVP